MTTKEQWYAHPDNRSELAVLLQNPTLSKALDVALDLGFKSTNFPINPVDLVQFFAIMGAKRDGYIEALKNLRALAQPEPTAKPLPKPWETPRKPGNPDQ